LIDEGPVVTILDESTEGWIKVSYPDGDDTVVGYIASDYLYTNPMATGTASRASIILREDSSNASPILAILADAAELDILDSLDGWYEVSSGGVTGYVEKRLVTTENDSQSIGYGTVTADSLTLRAEPSTDADPLIGLPAGTTFQITSNETEGWYGAIFNGRSGYVSADYVTFSDSVSSGYVQVTADTLTLRAGAGTAFAKLLLIPEGAVLPVSGSYGSWFQVTYGGYTGYVSGAYVSSTTEEGYRYYPNFAKVTAPSLILRKGPSTETDMLASIAENVVVEVLSKDGEFYKVKYDGMTGYIGAAFTTASNGPATVIVHEQKSSSGSSGSGNSTGNRKSSSSGSGKDYSGGSVVSSGSGSAVVDYAMQFIGNPYVWGGTSLTNGCDCSGFVMQVYAHFGVSLPHSSASLRSVGKGVSYSEARPGDIICQNHHVGIYVGNGQMVNAYGKNYGIIVSSATNKTVITVRRIFG
ncbi:MAG: SH3 domain-containing protein, partial [Oscillospiraceae bacterium]|nr:SH3 domain-containing protein [Oscillospiraceae bacterium]